MPAVERTTCPVCGRDQFRSPFDVRDPEERNGVWVWACPGCGVEVFDAGRTDFGGRHVIEVRLYRGEDG